MCPPGAPATLAPPLGQSLKETLTGVGVQIYTCFGRVAPADGCDATHLGALAQVPYTAQYVFYKAKTHGTVKVCGG